MSRKHFREHLASIGIASELQEEIYCTMETGDYNALMRSVEKLKQKGFSLEFIGQLVYQWEVIVRKRSSFEQELKERLNDPEFKELFEKEVEKIRQGKK